MAAQEEQLRIAQDLNRLREKARRAMLSSIDGADITTAWLSGSLVEGLGNQSSDVDIFVQVESLSASLPATRRDSDHYTYAFVDADTRYDIEFWPSITISNLAHKLDAARFDDPDWNGNHYLSYWESEFIHRIGIGLPLLDEAPFSQIRAQFNFVQFSKYLFEHCLRLFDDAFDDAVGMLADEQLPCAVLRCRDVVELSIDALLYASGVTNDKAKFRASKLRRLAEIYTEYQSYEELFWHFEAVLPKPESDQKSYAEGALRFAGDLIGALQDRLILTQWRHIYEACDDQPRSASILSTSLLRQTATVRR